MMIFKQHRELQHNIWNYLYFVIHIWYQNRENDSSLEMYVRSCIEREDVTWFPSGHTLYRSSFSNPSNCHNNNNNNTCDNRNSINLMDSIDTIPITTNNTMKTNSIPISNVNNNNHNNNNNGILMGDVKNEENELSSLKRELMDLKFEMRSINDKLSEKINQ